MTYSFSNLRARTTLQKEGNDGYVSVIGRTVQSGPLILQESNVKDVRDTNKFMSNV